MNSTGENGISTSLFDGGLNKKHMHSAPQTVGAQYRLSIMIKVFKKGRVERGRNSIKLLTVLL